MEIKVLAEYCLGDMRVLYYGHGDVVSLMIVPEAMAGEVKDSKLGAGDHMLQLFVSGDDFPGSYSQGISMRNSADLKKYKFVAQQNIGTQALPEIVTTFERDGGHVVKHHLKYNGEHYLTCYVEYFNNTEDDIELQMLSSFSLTGLTPFIDGEAENKLVMHRLRSCWSQEGLLESTPLEDFQLNPSWARHAVKSERFGQIGTMPVRKFFPFAAVEDTCSNVTWAAQLAWAGSWQLEVYRKDDAVSISGGLADFEFGHYKKLLKPTESIVTPEVYLTVTVGDVNEACTRLVEAQSTQLNIPESEQDLPIIYNEYCDTWGSPTQDKVNKQLESIKSLDIKYFVIDAGWYDNGDWSLSIGDWNECLEIFPAGIKKAAEAIRNAGLIPGIWFEFENVGIKSKAFTLYKDHFLKRDGKIIMTGTRVFWDFLDPWVQTYLYDKVIKFLKENKIGYLKVDYNDTYGMGCDGAESYGEAQRQQVMAVQDFFRRIKSEIPDIVIENCSSGGHRLEPSMMSLCSMASFSDAHECTSIPIIAGNLHRAILPRQSQIWAVLHKDNDDRRLVYSLANTFLGRMCISGSIYELSSHQMEFVKNAIDFYKASSHIIKNGKSFIYGPKIKSYNSPEGWQCVLRISDETNEILAVINTFGGELPNNIEIELPANKYKQITHIFSETDINPTITGQKLIVPVLGNFSAVGILLK